MILSMSIHVTTLEVVKETQKNFKVLHNIVEL